MERDTENTLIRFSELSQFELDPTVAPLLPVDFCLERHVVILGKPPADTSEPIRVGMLNTKNLPLTAELEDRLDRKVHPVQLNAFEINRALSEIYGITFIEEGQSEIRLSYKTKIDFSEDRNPSLILNDLLSAALRRRATDIHMETYEGDVDLRFRVDGTLLLFEFCPTCLIGKDRVFHNVLGYRFHQWIVRYGLRKDCPILVFWRCGDINL